MRFQKQEGIRDCGVCCLKNIIKFYKGNIDLEKLRKITKTNENGTSIYNLVEASNNLGFKSKAYKCDINDLSKVTYPLIALIKLNNYNHFIIIKEINFDEIKIFDPIRGDLSYSLNEFLKYWQKIIITFDRDGEIINEDDYYINYIKDIIKDNKKNIIVLIITSLLCAMFSLLTSILLKKVFDNSIKRSTLTSFTFLLLIKLCFEYFKSRLSLILNNKIDYSLSSRVYEKIYSLPLIYHHNRPVGDIASRINDLYSIENFISMVTISSIIDVLLITFSLLIILYIKFRLFIIFLLFTFLLFIIYYFFRNEENNLLDDFKVKSSNMHSSFIESIMGINTIKHLNLEDKILEKQKINKKEYIISYNKFYNLISLQTLLINFIESYGIIIVLIISYYLLNKNKLSIGELSFIYTIFVIYFSSIKNLITLDKNFIDSNLSYKRIYSLLNTNIEKSEKKNIKNIETIKFENVSFSYNNTKVLDKYNLVLSKGENVFVSGVSGSGKSTLFKLLDKELEINTGNIYINNENINEIKTNSIRNNICYVSQDEYIFSDTVKNNILMGKNVKNKEIEKVLKITMLDKVLKKRNIDLDYNLEENGQNLSGGERCKILLARTLLRNIDFVILDETLNELDIKQERIILERILTEYKKTFIFISHRDTNKDLFNKSVII